MAKRKKKYDVPVTTTKPVIEALPVPTRRSFLVCVGSIVAGMVIQIVMAAFAFGHIPAEIPSGWIGWAPLGGSLPSWTVFVAFPGAQLIVLIVAVCSPKNEDGRRVMDSGRAIGLMLLAVLFTVLQSSAFRLAH